MRVDGLDDSNRKLMLMGHQPPSAALSCTVREYVDVAIDSYKETVSTLRDRKSRELFESLPPPIVA